MTELSALAGSEGYAARDDEAKCRSPSAARGRGTLLYKKAVEAFLYSLTPCACAQGVFYQSSVISQPRPMNGSSATPSRAVASSTSGVEGS